MINVFYTNYQHLHMGQRKFWPFLRLTPLRGALTLSCGSETRVLDMAGSHQQHTFTQDLTYSGLPLFPTKSFLYHPIMLYYPNGTAEDWQYALRKE